MWYIYIYIYIHIYIDVIYTYIYMIYMCIWLWYQGLFHVISPSAFVCTVSLVRCCILFRAAAAAAAATETRECRGLPGSMGLASASLVLWGHLVGREQFVYSVMATNASHTFPGQADWPKFYTCSVAFLSPTPSFTHPLTCTPTHALPGSSATDACAAPSKKGAATPQSHGKKRRRSAESPKDEELIVPDDPEFNPEAIVFCFRTESSLVGNTVKAFPNSAMWNLD